MVSKLAYGFVERQRCENLSLTMAFVYIFCLNLNVPDAISKGIQAVKPCSNKIIQFITVVGTC